MDIGVNLARPGYSIPPQFADIRLSAGSPTKVSGTGVIGPNGWPVGPCKSNALYYLSAETREYIVKITQGAASQVTVTQPAGAAGTTVNTNIPAKFDANGIARFKAAGLPGHGISIAVTTTDPGETRWAIVAADDFDLWQSNPKAFAPWWRNWLKSFCKFFRAMDWMRTNDDKASGYPESDPLTQFAPFTAGVPISVIVDLALQTGMTPWIEIGAYDDDDTVRSIFERLKPVRDAGIFVRVSWSNEVWNTGFMAHTYAVEQDKALWWNTEVLAPYLEQLATYNTAVASGSTTLKKPVAPADPDGRVYYGYRSAQVSKVIQGMGWVSRVHFGMGIGCQTATPDRNTLIWNGVARAGGNDKDFGAWVVTAYVTGTLTGADDVLLPLVRNGDLEGGYANLIRGEDFQRPNTDPKTMATKPMLDPNKGMSVAWMVGNLAKHATIAKDHDLPLEVYEGNEHLNTLSHYATTNLVSRGVTDVTQGDVQSYFAKLQRSDGAKAVMRAILDTAEAAGVTRFAIFNDLSNFGLYGNFGIYGTPAAEAAIEFVTDHAVKPPTELDAINAAIAELRAQLDALAVRVQALAA